MAALKSLDDSIRARAARNHSVVLRAFSEVKQSEAARLLGQSESSLSEWKDAQLERAMQVLAALGLKPVPVEHQLVSPEKLSALKTFARIGLDADISSDFGELT